MIGALLGAVLFGLAAFIGGELGTFYGQRVERFEDGPPPAAAPLPLLIAGSALIGAFVATHARAPIELATSAIVALALVAGWCTDARAGILPDVFTLGPLVLIVALALAHNEWSPIVSAAIATLPFALLAVLSRGRGIGWGDVKLVALGGAVMGLQLSLTLFAVACAVAAAANALRKHRGAFAFGPYLACAIAAGLPIGILQ